MGLIQALVVHNARRVVQINIIPHSVLLKAIVYVNSALLVLLANTGQGAVCNPVLVHVNHVPQTVLQVITNLDVALPVQEPVHHASHVKMAFTYQPVEVWNLAYARNAQYV